MRASKSLAWLCIGAVTAGQNERGATDKGRRTYREGRAQCAPHRLGVFVVDVFTQDFEIVAVIDPLGQLWV